MGVTLKEIAKKAGLSVSTVSMALRNDSRISVETLQKVHRVASELNYVPNVRARAFVSRRTMTIGLVIPNLENSFYAELVHSIEDEIGRTNYNLILGTTDDKEANEIRYANMFRSGLVDGAIFACSVRDDGPIFDLAKSHLPVVFIERHSSDTRLIPVVRADVRTGIYRATRHLLDMGHSSIVFAGLSDDARVQGFRQAMEEKGIELHDDSFIRIPYTFEGGLKAATVLLAREERPTGVICFNDEIAMGLIQAIHEAALRVPDDISVCGTDNIRISRYYSPSLTTVDIPKDQMGREAVNLLLELLDADTEQRQEHQVIYPTELIVRSSTGRPR